MMIKQNITETIAINIEGEVDPYYFTVLKDRYEKVPTEYQDAKTLFEMYAEKMVMVPLSKEESEQGGISRYEPANKKIWIDVQKDIYAIESGGIFFHEFAHMVVDLNHMYEKVVPVGRFKEFSEALIAEASDYIGKWEKQASELAEKYRVAPERREKFIYNKTMELMKKDILESNSYFFPYGSLSDILDGGSHDKYQISQGHCPEDGHAYWKLPYHLPDETFADIFRCQILGLKEEITKIKKIFSKSYEMYNTILKSIINK